MVGTSRGGGSTGAARLGFAAVALAAGLVCAAIGQEALPEPADDGVPAETPEFSMVGSEMCVMCHPEQIEDSGELRHVRVIMREEEKGRLGGCEACHGPGSAHTESAEPELIYGSGDEDMEWVAESCFKCHSTLTKESWLESGHHRAEVMCDSCHSMHDPNCGEKLLKYDPDEDEKERDLCLGCHKTVGASLRYYSHHPVLEDPLACSDCHDPHVPSPTETGGQPVIEECIECHRDKEPPFVFEHEPATSDLADGCLTCHQSHGAPNNGLLKLPGRALCIQCHTEQAVGHQGAGTCWQTGCHEQMHGSNTDPLFRQ